MGLKYIATSICTLLLSLNTFATSYVSVLKDVDIYNDQDTITNQSLADSTDLSVPSDTIVEVKKGYSPFTNYVDTFLVELSPDQNKALPSKTPSLNDKDRIQHFLKDSNNEKRFLHEYDLSYSKTALKKTWIDYLNDTQTISTPSGKSVSQESISINNNNELLTQKSESTNSTINSNETIAVAIKETTANAIPTTETTFYIQLAALKNEINSERLKTLYKDPSAIVHRKEDSWHKYQVNAGTDYETACLHLKALNGQQAFIVAYKGNNKLNLWETIQQAKKKLKPKQSIEFVVQIAASRSPMTPTQIKALHSDGDNVRTIYEDGWYKYQILTGSSYNLTLHKWRLTGTTKSFPVAYKGKKKIEMSEALKTIRKQKQ